MRDASLGIEEHGHAQQAIQPYSMSTPCHRFERDLEEAGGFGLGMYGIVPMRILFR